MTGCKCVKQGVQTVKPRPEQKIMLQKFSSWTENKSNTSLWSSKTGSEFHTLAWWKWNNICLYRALEYMLPLCPV